LPGDVREIDHHRSGQAEHDRLEGQDRGTPAALGGPLPHGAPDSLLSPPSRVRASPTVTTEPVTSTAPVPIDEPNASPASASAVPSSMASARRGGVVSRSGPNTSRATAASSTAGIARWVEFWVQTT